MSGFPKYYRFALAEAKVLKSLSKEDHKCILLFYKYSDIAVIKKMFYMKRCVCSVSLKLSLSYKTFYSLYWFVYSNND